MDIRAVFELCKNSFGNDIRYLRQNENGTYEAHEVKQRSLIKYIFDIKDEKIRILEEKEEKL
ncbi:MAG: hypothetical protein ACM3UU_00605 [Ignavibacteriales bacterium]